MNKIIAAVAVSCIAIPALAQSNCLTTEAMRQGLTEGFGEQQNGIGITPGGLLVEMWSNPKTGTWTAVITRPDGQSCIAANGTDWRNVPQGEAM